LVTATVADRDLPLTISSPIDQLDSSEGWSNYIHNTKTQ